jgi:hypothetical protein
MKEVLRFSGINLVCAAVLYGFGGIMWVIGWLVSSCLWR